MASAMIETAILAAFLAFCRIGGCFMLMPGFASVRVPMQVRLFIAVAATLALLATMWDTIAPAVDRRPDQLARLVASEVMIGALIGLMARLYVLALQFIGSGIAMMTGFGGMQGGHQLSGQCGSGIRHGSYLRCCGAGSRRVRKQQHPVAAESGTAPAMASRSARWDLRW